MGAILIQTDKNGTCKPTAYASWSLTTTERKYCQTEKEALSAVWACEKFHIYLHRTEFDLYTDHKALETIYSPTRKPCGRIQRWSLRLQPYKMNVKYMPGKHNPADYLSRFMLTHQIPEQHSTLSDDAEHFLRFITLNSVPKHIPIQTLIEESKHDQDTNIFKDCLQNNNWASTKITRQYKSSQHNFAYKDPLILMNSRILIPVTLRKKVLNLGHKGHVGIVKMKSLMSTKVWWPNMNTDIENFVKSCICCTATSEPDKPPQIQPTKTPNKPWEVIHMDLCGPFPNRNVILALIDEYSRWPEVNVFRRNPSTQQVIDHLRKISAVHGIPYKIVADNGPQFRKQNKELKSFCLEMGIHFRNVTPYWPRANGEIERFFRTLKKTMQSSNLEGRQWQHDLFDFLLLYRSSLHCSTNESPSSLLMKRNIRNKLPSLEEDLKAIEPQTGTVSFDSKSKAYQIKYNKRYSSKVTINTGDKVLMKQIKRNKLSTNFSPEPMKITQIQRSQVMATFK